MGQYDMSERHACRLKGGHDRRIAMESGRQAAATNSVGSD
jgi:hypothetical protein